MRQTLLLFCFIVLALVTAALLSYPVYLILDIFSDIPFHKIISRLSSLCGLLFIFLYLRFNNNLNARTIGFNLADPHPGSDIIRGFVSGVLIILVLETLLLLLDIHIPEPELEFSPEFIAGMIIKALVAGIMVALLEELLYRGALLGGLAAKTGTLNAIITSSLIYAAVHFIRFPRIHADVDISWQTGLISLSGAFHRFMDPAIL
ncbi:MAG TPA: CPBP family intramembrane glutamic endopeptidase, partial [Gammaproteobacteria bacterium]|nr:CPBP family intramembrane glutamic endopeptidase [Gammaproteobacteria bacterium]